MTLRIDAVVMVDWSSAAAPTTGADSIWIARHRTGAEAPDLVENPPTRAAAMDRIAGMIRAARADGDRLLIGFDFPFGYPEGAAARLTGRPGARWDAVWALLADRIEDGPKNANNRFEVAAALNGRCFDGEGPFWGRPPSRSLPSLPAKKPQGYGARYPAERRAIERAVPRAQPVWKLYTTGSVGGQALTGIAALERLRRAPDLAGAVAIWPFETGFAPPSDAAATIVEIYPSLYPPEPDPIKDAGQVRAVARRFAARAAEGALAADFAPSGLSGAVERAARDEEAWIFGVDLPG